jgi:2-amino-4-hydroxy-6-hydroxymethyldihydropteridine diphosphokinase
MMTYYLSLGANIGEREQTLRQALHMLEQQVGFVRRCSSFYYSPPWGFESENEFCNLCCAIKTEQAPLAVLHLTQAIERALGRSLKSSEGVYHDRTIDIDLIRVFDEDESEVVIDTEELTLPHRFWQERAFVTIPLKEIMPL